VSIDRAILQRLHYFLDYRTSQEIYRNRTKMGSMNWDKSTKIIEYDIRGEVSAPACWIWVSPTIWPFRPTLTVSRNSSCGIRRWKAGSFCRMTFRLKAMQT